jgi:hypothetical protein
VWEALRIAAYVVLPLAYGLLVEYLFERVRRKRGARLPTDEVPE